jgi:hypothetical protein
MDYSNGHTIPYNSSYTQPVLYSGMDLSNMEETMKAQYAKVRLDFPFDIIRDMETEDRIIQDAQAQKRLLEEGLKKDLIRGDMTEFLKIDYAALKRNRPA